MPRDSSAVHRKGLCRWDVSPFRKEPGRYLADDRLRDAVRTAIALERPLLVTGEPGTGNGAGLVARIGAGSGRAAVFSPGSDSHAADILYHFDHVLRFYEAQTQNARAIDPANYAAYRTRGKRFCRGCRASPCEGLAQALRTPEEAGRAVVLIDEVDKAPRDFPNDLLDEIDQMKFSVKEIPGLTFQATYRPLIVISNNSERQLPDAFLRRCVFHYIEFPKEPDLRKLAERIAANLPKALIDGCIHHFQALREMGKRNELDKPPATAELESWIRVLLMAQVPAEQIASSELKDFASGCAAQDPA